MLVPVELGKLLFLACAFGVLATAHVALLFELALTLPRVRLALAFLVPPLAPYFGFRAGKRWWSWIWVGAALLYAANALSALF